MRTPWLFRMVEDNNLVTIISRKVYKLFVPSKNTDFVFVSPLDNLHTTSPSR